MAVPSVQKIGNAKPVLGGVKAGPLGTTLPTDTVATPNVALVALGYVSEDGLQPEGERSTNAVKDWAGDIIAQLQTEHSSRFTFTLYGLYDGDVLKAAFGDDNVVQTSPGKYTVVEDGTELPHKVWFFDIRGDGGKKLRICIPDGQASNVTEGPLVPGELQSLTLTLEAFKDAAGNKVYRYYDDGSTPAAPVIVGDAPASVAAAGGDLVTLTGSGFTGTIGVTVDGDPAPEFTVISDTVLVFTAPAQSAGTYQVVVTNATGPSAAYTGVTYV